MRRLILVSLGLLLAAAWPTPAAPAKKKPEPAAAKPAAPPSQRLGGFDAWSAYFYKDKSGRVCYMVGDPQKTEPAGVKRKPAPTAMVTHRPEENVSNVVSFTEGYPVKEGSSAAVAVDGTKFDLFTNGDTAWSRTAELDRMIVEAMMRGKEAVVTATPQKGPETIDTYSLAGFSKTLALIDKSCGIKR